jgi:hypothetical protein
LVGRLVEMLFDDDETPSIGIITKQALTLCTVEFPDSFKSTYNLDVVEESLFESDTTSYAPKRWLIEQSTRFVVRWPCHPCFVLILT